MSSSVSSSTSARASRGFLGEEEEKNCFPSSSSSSIPSTGHGSFVGSRVQSFSFINPDPITKRRIAEDNTQLRRPYTRKNGEEPIFRPIAPKSGGTALGTLFEKQHKVPTNPKPLSKWLGKVSEGDEATPTTCTGVSQVLERMNTGAILEKLSYDLYREFGRRLFSYPKSLLSNQPIKDAFNSNHALALHLDQLGLQRSLRVMSQYMEGYEDLCKLSCLDGSSSVPIMEFIKKHKRPPEKVLTPDGREIPLIGLIPLIAVGRILGDIDCIGSSGTNAGYRWIKTAGVIIGIEIIKIDPGFCFQFFPGKTTNFAFNTLHQTNGTKLTTPKDLQIASSSNDVIILWDKLTPLQKEAFISVLFNATRYIYQEEVLSFLFHREGAFDRTPHEHLVPQVANKYSSALKTWLNDQLTIYADELKQFKQNYPDRVLRARYVDAFGEIPLPASDEAFPIRELFTQLTLISTVEKEKNQNTIQANLPERDALFEALERLDRTTTSISLESLFVPLAVDGNKPIHKVLLIGGAGIGKTTLCQKIAHDWASGQLWHQYDFIFWLPLRKLNALVQSSAPLAGVAALDQWLARAIALIALEDSSLENKILQLIQQKPEKSLILFDGYDEAHPALIAALAPFFRQNRHPLLLTSRPGAAESLRPQMDRFVENSGFSDENMRTYVRKHFTRGERYRFDTSTTQLQFFAAIQANRNLFAVAHIPLQLQMLCILWESEAHRTGFPANSTSLYAKMIDQIILWHERRSNKRFSPVQKENLIEALGQIAYRGFQTGKLIIPAEIIQAQAQQSQVVEEDLLSLGILKKTADAYTFLHLTFQEYLIAYTVSKKTVQERESFILQHRYFPQFQLVIAFLGGLIAQQDKSSDRKEVKHFLTTLHAQGADLIGAYQFELTLRCLNECSDPQIEKWVEEKYHVYETLVGLVIQNLGSYLDGNKDVRDWTIRLFKFNNIPDRELKKTIDKLKGPAKGSLWDDEGRSEGALSVLKNLGERALPERWLEVFKTLREALNARDDGVRINAVEALGILGVGAPAEKWRDVFRTIKGALSDREEVVQKGAIESLKKLVEKAPLGRWEDVFESLKGLLNDSNYHARRYAISALITIGKEIYPEKWEDVFGTLKGLLSDPDVRETTITALGTFGQGTPLGRWQDVFETLKALLSNSNTDVQSSTIEALGELVQGVSAEKWSEVFEALKELLRDPKDKWGAKIKALEKLAKGVPAERWGDVFELLKGLLRDPTDPWGLKIKTLEKLAERAPPERWKDVFELLKGLLNGKGDVRGSSPMQVLEKLTEKASPENWGDILETMKGFLSTSFETLRGFLQYSHVRTSMMQVLEKLARRAPPGRWGDVFEVVRRALDVRGGMARRSIGEHFERLEIKALEAFINGAPPERWKEVFEMIKEASTSDISVITALDLEALCQSALTERWQNVFETLKAFLSNADTGGQGILTDSTMRPLITALRMLGQGASAERWRAVFETLKGALSNSSTLVKGMIIYALGMLGQGAPAEGWEAVFETLKGFLSNPDTDVQYSLVFALEELSHGIPSERQRLIFETIKEEVLLKDSIEKREKLMKYLMKNVPIAPLLGMLLPDKRDVAAFIHGLIKIRRPLYFLSHSDPLKAQLCMVENNQIVSIPVLLEKVRSIHQLAAKSPLGKYVKSYANISSEGGCSVQ